MSSEDEGPVRKYLYTRQDLQDQQDSFPVLYILSPTPLRLASGSFEHSEYTEKIGRREGEVAQKPPAMRRGGSMKLHRDRCGSLLRKKKARLFLSQRAFHNEF
jgi:hypothetical protein